MSAFIKAAVIGHPIAHSKSPLIHNYWIEKYGLSGLYEAIDLTQENFSTELYRLVGEGYKGFNITIPHKEAALRICDSVDQSARRIGAVNTIIVKENQLHGLNTDGFGFLENIRQTDPDFDFKNIKAVVMGAGGAARAVISTLLEEGVAKVFLTNRTRNKAEILRYSEKIEIIDWAARHEILKHADFLVNTTSLGMKNKPELELDLSALPQKALVNDIVYAPLHTLLLKNAEIRGNPVVTGIGMLLHQARPAFQAWFGLMPEVTPELQEKVLAL